MLKIIKGNIFEADCQALVNTVNCVGVMGKGLALEFKKRYPMMFLAYRKYANEGLINPGIMHVWNDKERYIINFPTKNHWKNPSKMEWIISGLKDLVGVIEKEEIKSIAIPALGCNLGGLSWHEVKLEIEKIHDLHWKNVKVMAFEP